MQTFLPYPDFEKSFLCLDVKRHGNQRVEALQLLRSLGNCVDVDLSDLELSPKRGWSNHPAALMWRGYEGALALYHDAAILTWIRRGYRNTMRLRSRREQSHPLPPWWGDPGFHASHRSNLLRKNPEHYGQFGWGEGPDLPYVWPSIGAGARS